MHKLALYALIVLTLGAAIGSAQTAPPPPAPAAQPAPPKPTVEPLTELQRTKLDKIAAQMLVIQMRAQTQFDHDRAPMEAERAALIAEIVKDHPGFIWHESLGPGDASGLVPDPAAKIVSPPASKK